jgi:hypothetical protein
VLSSTANGKLQSQHEYKQQRQYDNTEWNKQETKRNNNSVQLIIYVPSQQLQGQLQTQHSVDTSNYIMDNHNIKSKSNYRQALEEKHITAEKETNKQKSNNTLYNIVRNTLVKEDLKCVFAWRWLLESRNM